MSRRVLRIGLVVLLVGRLGLVWWSRDTLTPAAVVAWVEGLGVWGPLVFVGIYCLAPALFVPGAVLTLAGGALFGPLAGALLSLTGATVLSNMVLYQHLCHQPQSSFVAALSINPDK